MQRHFFRFATITFCLAGSAAFTIADPGATESSGTSFLDMRYEPSAVNLASGSNAVYTGPLDNYKNVQLNADWTMTLGGEFRYRFESETDKFLGAGGSHDSFHLFRFLFNAEFKFQNLFTIYFEGIHAFDEDRDLFPRPTDENYWDIEQLYVDFEANAWGKTWDVRVGRQFLSYGADRFVSPGEWNNVRQRFDGVRMSTSDATWDHAMWWVRPVRSFRKQHDRLNPDIDFWGWYSTNKPGKYDVYFFALIDSGFSVNPNGNVGSGGDRNIYTAGTRHWGNWGNWDWETEVAGQWGHWSGDTVQAYSVSADAGYNFPNINCEPRLGFGYDLATGDKNPADSGVQTFTQLFPDSHRYFGYLDLIGRQNITSANVNLSAWVVKDVSKAVLAFHSFWLTNEKDALYGSGGGALARDPAGNSGREVGYELDATLTWKLDADSDLLLGWSHMWDNEFLQSVSPGENPDFFYVQYTYRF